jgi:dTDP-L-rhamnose 4-epimerase
MGKRVLVTGGAGFIGSFLTDALVARGHDVTVFDNLEEQVHGKKRPNYLNPGARHVWGDVLDAEALCAVALEAEVIFHLAALVGVGQSQYQVRRYVEANTLGTANLLDVLANNRHRCEKLVVAASMSSYGEGSYCCEEHGLVRPPLRSEQQLGAGEWELRCPRCRRLATPVPITEEGQQLCNSVYAITKKDQEEMVLLFGRTYGLPAVALRYFNVYGPRQSLCNPYTGVAAIFLSRLKNGQPPVVYEDGGQTRDFVSVHDIVQANLLAMEKPEADGEVFNVGSGHVTTIAEVAHRLAALTGRSAIQPDITRRFRKGDVRHCTADIGKIRQRLGYRPQVSFDGGMRELLGWSREAEAVDRFDEAAGELARRGLA